jgi:hypothetical protein
MICVGPFVSFCWNCKHNHAPYFGAEKLKEIKESKKKK